MRFVHCAAVFALGASAGMVGCKSRSFGETADTQYAYANKGTMFHGDVAMFLFTYEQTKGSGHRCYYYKEVRKNKPAGMVTVYDAVSSAQLMNQVSLQDAELAQMVQSKVDDKISSARIAELSSSVSSISSALSSTNSSRSYHTNAAASSASTASSYAADAAQLQGHFFSYVNQPAGEVSAVPHALDEKVIGDIVEILKESDTWSKKNASYGSSGKGRFLCPSSLQVVSKLTAAQVQELKADRIQFP